MSPIRRFAPLLLSVAFNLIAFYALLHQGFSWNSAYLFSVLVATLPVIFFWSIRLPARFFLEGVAQRLPEDLIYRLLALFLGGGTLAALVDAAHLAPTIAILPAVFVSAFVLMLGAQARRPQLETTPLTRDRSIMLAIIAYAVALRIVYSWTFELLHEEAYYWNYGQHLDIGYLDHPPMVGWLIRLFTTLFGQTEFAVQLGALGCWMIAAFYLYKLTHAVSGESAAFRAMLLAAVLPVFFGNGLIMTPDAPLMACWAGAIYYLHRALIAERRGAWLGVGLFMGLGLLSKYTIALLGLSAISFLIIDRDARKWWRRPEPYLALLAALALFSPVILWNAQHQWASFAFQGTKRLTGDFNFSLPALLGAVLLLLTPTGALAAIAVVLSKTSRLNPSADIQHHRADRLLLLSVLIPFAVFFLCSLTRQTKLNWTGPLWIGVMPSITALMIHERSASPGRPSWTERFARYAASAWPATIVIFLLAYGVIFYHVAVGFPGVPYTQIHLGSDIPAIFGLTDFAEQVGRLEQEYERQHGEKPMIVCVDADRLAGWIAFYRAKETPALTQEFVQNVTGGHLFGKESHMYGYWHPMAQYRNRPLLVIAIKESAMRKKQVVWRLRPLSPIGKVWLRKNGKLTLPFFYQFARQR